MEFKPSCVIGLLNFLHRVPQKTLVLRIDQLDALPWQCQELQLEQGSPFPEWFHLLQRLYCNENKEVQHKKNSTKTENGDKLTLIVCDETKNIMILLKANNNSNIFYFLNFSLDDTADAKSFHPLHLGSFGIYCLQPSNLDRRR